MTHVRTSTTSAHGFSRGQAVRIRDGYEFSNPVRTGEVVTQMADAQPAWAVRCEFDGKIHYLRPDGIEVVPGAPGVAPQQAPAEVRTFTPPPAADPIHAAIRRHRAAYEAYQVAPEGRLSVIANDEYDAASEALVSTASATRFGALALLEHLRWWLREEIAFAAGHQPAYGLAQARAADLTLFLGTNLPPVAIPRAMPSGRLPQACDRYRQNAPSALPNEPLPGEDEPWQAVAPVRPDTPHCRALRFLDTGAEALAALAIIAGGVVLTGLTTLL